jgi:hypothetical protein
MKKQFRYQCLRYTMSTAPHNSNRSWLSPRLEKLNTSSFRSSPLLIGIGVKNMPVHEFTLISFVRKLVNFPGSRGWKEVILPWLTNASMMPDKLIPAAKLSVPSRGSHIQKSLQISRVSISRISYTFVLIYMTITQSVTSTPITWLLQSKQCQLLWASLRRFWTHQLSDTYLPSSRYDCIAICEASIPGATSSSPSIRRP